MNYNLDKEEVKNTIRGFYKNLLNRDADSMGLNSYLTRVVNNSLTLDQVYEEIKNSPEAKTISSPVIAYTDIRIKGKTLSQGYRDCEQRYDEIAKFCKKYNRPISVLDLGAAEGYFTIRLAEEFDGVFVAVECDPSRKLLDLCEKNSNDKVLLLQKKMNLDDLQLLKEVQYFDIVIAQNIIHHFDEPFQNVLDTIVSMCSYCFFEHPNSMEGKTTKNHERIKTEILDVHKFDAKLLKQTESGLEDKIMSQEIKRNLWVLTNNKEKTIDRGWRNSLRYEKQFGKGKQIRIIPNFDNIELEYGHRQERRAWISGIDLRTFLENEGVYPTRDQIINLIDNLAIKNPIDLGPHNLILTGSELYAIDQKEKRDNVDSKDKLKKYLIEDGLL